MALAGLSTSDSATGFVFFKGAVTGRLRAKNALPITVEANARGRTMTASAAWTTGLRFGELSAAETGRALSPIAAAQTRQANLVFICAAS